MPSRRASPLPYLVRGLGPASQEPSAHSPFYAFSARGLGSRQEFDRVNRARHLRVFHVTDRRLAELGRVGSVAPMSTAPASGFLHGGTPYLRLGDGPPLVMVQGLTPQHDVPKGWERRMLVSSLAPLAGALHDLLREPQARAAARRVDVRHRSAPCGRDRQRHRRARVPVGHELGWVRRAAAGHRSSGPRPAPHRRLGGVSARGRGAGARRGDDPPHASGRPERCVDVPVRRDAAEAAPPPDAAGRATACCHRSSGGSDGHVGDARG